MKSHPHFKRDGPKYRALWCRINDPKIIRHDYGALPGFHWHDQVESLIVVNLRTKEIIHNYGDTFRLQVYWTRKTQYSKSA